MEGIKPVLIDLSDYEAVGEGANGISLNHRTDPHILLKLYNEGKFRQSYDEWVLSKRVYETGIPTPEPGDFVTEGKRFGLRLHRILGKKSFARAIGDEPEKVGEYAREFARMCLDLHSTRVDTSLFESVKSRYLRLLEENPFFSDGEKAKPAGEYETAVAFVLGLYTVFAILRSGLSADDFTRLHKRSVYNYYLNHGSRQIRHLYDTGWAGKYALRTIFYPLG